MMTLHLDQLNEADRHIAMYRQRIAEQEQRISNLERDGHNTVDARALLVTFRRTLLAGQDHRRLILESMALGHR
jgi:hypothetical protein